MATRNTTTRARSTPAKSSRKRAVASTSRASRAGSLTEDARIAVRAVRSRATRAARKVPTDRTSLSIAAGVVAGIVAASVAIFMNRDRLRTVAASGGERLKKAADDLSMMAHEHIDQARDNITRFRARGDSSEAASDAGNMAVTG